MKKQLLAAGLTVMMLAAAGCSGAKTNVPATSEAPSEIGMANPWTEDENADAAAQAAGVGYFVLPENGTEYDGGKIDFYSYQHMEELAEADGDIGAASIIVRKGLKQNSEDVSGDYTEYAKTWSFGVDGFTVNCYGQEEGKANKILWLSDNFSYSICVYGQGDDNYGIGDNDVKALVAAIQ